MEKSWLATYAEIEAGSVAARNAIEAHLAQLPGGEERDYWQAIAERYVLDGGGSASSPNSMQKWTGVSVPMRRFNRPG